MADLKGLSYREIDDAAHDYAQNRLYIVSQGQTSEPYAEVFDSADIAQAYSAGVRYALEQVAKNRC